MPVNAQQRIEDALAARIIEQLAGSGAASIPYVASRLEEDTLRIGTIANNLLRNGIVQKQGEQYVVAKKYSEAMAELVIDDGLSLLGAAQDIKEAGDNYGEDVDNAPSVHDQIVPSPNTQSIPQEPKDQQYDPATDEGRVDNTVDLEPGVHDAVEGDPTTQYQSKDDAAPGGVGTGSDIGSDSVDTKKDVQDAVPFDSANTGIDPTNTGQEKQRLPHEPGNRPHTSN